MPQLTTKATTWLEIDAMGVRRTAEICTFPVANRGLGNFESFLNARLMEAIPFKTVRNLQIHMYIQEHPSPVPSYPSGEQDWVDVSLRRWAKSIKTHTTDQNLLCEYRYNRHVYCRGAILPAAQTATVWQMELPRVRERNEITESFRPADEVQAEVNDARDALRKVVAGYQNQWQTHVEGEDLLRGHIKRIERLKNLASIHESPAIMSGKLGRPAPELEDKWNLILNEHGLPKEINFYPAQFVYKTFDGREHSPDDEDDRDAGFGADNISYDGMRETLGDRPNDHQERKRWFPWFRAVLNEEEWTSIPAVPEGFTAIGGWTAERETEIRNHPKFRARVALYQILFSGKSIEELGIDKGSNTTAKWLARTKDTKFHSISESDRQKAIGHYVCTVVLNNRHSLKILAPLDGQLAHAVKALNLERQKAQRKAADNARQDAKAKRLGKRATETLIAEGVRRIDDAYAKALIMADRGIAIGDCDGDGDGDGGTPAGVIFSSISRGAAPTRFYRSLWKRARQFHNHEFAWGRRRPLGETLTRTFCQRARCFPRGRGESGQNLLLNIGREFSSLHAAFAAPKGSSTPAVLRRTTKNAPTVCKVGQRFFSCLPSMLCQSLCEHPAANESSGYE